MIIPNVPQPLSGGLGMYGSDGVVEPIASLALNGLNVLASLVLALTSGTFNVAPATSPLSSSMALASASTYHRLLLP